MRNCDELDFTNQQAVQHFLENEKPDYVVLAAEKVGGIWANENYPAEFIYTNMMIEANVIHQAYKAGVQQLLFLGSPCIYPEFAEQPMQEEALLTGELEPMNEPYAIAKIAGIKICELYDRQYGTDFRSVMPTNLYGPNDNYDSQNSHVISALIQKIHQAKIDKADSLEIRGSGRAQREFMYVDDLSDACVMLMEKTKADYLKDSTERCSHINIGTGTDVSIKERVELIQSIVGYRGDIEWDTSKLDGTPKKLLNVGKLENVDWVAPIELKAGLERTYQDYLAAL